MKRAIAVLLSMAMVLSLMGCTSKETEKAKKSKKTKKTKTEETDDPDDTDPSESTDETDPTEDTDPTDTDPSDTSETSDPADSSTSGTSSSGNPFNMDIPALSHDLTLLTFTGNSVDHTYAELAENEEIYMVDYGRNVRYVEDDGYDALNDYLYQLDTETASQMDGLYEAGLDALDEIVKNADSNAYWGERLYTYTIVRPYRTDSKVCSFYTNTYTNLTDTNTDMYSFHNLISATAEEMGFDDIVFDRGAFTEVLSEYILFQDPNGPSESIEDRNAALTSLIENIKDGSEISFLMTQNTIILFQEGSSAGAPTLYSFSFPVLHLGGCVDLSYFTSTAEYFYLNTDANNEIYWDFDEDGSLDIVTVTDTSDSYSFDFEISYNGNICPKGDIDFLDLDFVYAVSWVTMVHTDSGYYLYVELSVEDPVNTTLVYHLNNGSFDYVGSTGKIGEVPYNPNCVKIFSRSELLGTGQFIITSTLIGNNGIPKTTSAFYERSAVVATKMDMNLGIFDGNGNPTGDSIKIPAGTVVELFGVDTEHGLAYFSTLNRDESENKEFQMIVYKEDSFDDYYIYFDGYREYDLFVGQHYYD